MRTLTSVVVVLVLAAGVYAQSDRSRELQLADTLEGSRRAFQADLENLVNYYAQSGQYLKLRNAREELNHLLTFSPLDYVRKTDAPRRAAKGTQYIEEAEILYQDGVMYKEYPDLFNKKDRLLLAIARFDRLLTKHPQSERVDDAAFMLAEIRGGFYFKEWDIAVDLYEKCIKWNAGTPHPARFRAAEIYLKKMQDYDRAAAYFRWSAEKDLDPDVREQSAEYLKKMREKGYLIEPAEEETEEDTAPETAEEVGETEAEAATEEEAE